MTVNKRTFTSQIEKESEKSNKNKKQNINDILFNVYKFILCNFMKLINNGIFFSNFLKITSNKKIAD